MKKIGFIDYYLDEWHAVNYPNWIREEIRASGRECSLSYAWAQTYRPGGMNTAAWCDLYGLKALDSIDEVVEKSDYIIVLSPDNPEHHERLASIPLLSGKPVYIDKTFSPDLQSGVRIFEKAEKYSTPVFSSSALRFAKEFSEFPNDIINKNTIDYMATCGAGNFKNYAVHQFEMIVSNMGIGAKKIKSLSTNNARSLIVDYSDGRRASMLQANNVPFQALLKTKDGEGTFISECSDIFVRLIREILNFFETGISPVPKIETLEIMALIESGNKALEKR